MRAVFAERVSQGFYLNINVNRSEAARYGMTVQDVQRAVQSGIGGEDVGSDVMKPIAAPIVGGMIGSTIHVLIVVPVFFELIQKRAPGAGQ